ncbi:NUDIX hydrolase [Pedobacter sp. MC2016-14]|uniref:NUDIX hydrolase n=1 Tax=Pedobacter sp. MC2016-14 TaxID=2897327 RepID=UPI001E5E91BE|nr:NUDIX domain-containing protein [Pedobacter sp. MC2016-14]MCD0487953.1 NUDIX hydrolase [Pedobacter sp. MC2016-14]
MIEHTIGSRMLVAIDCIIFGFDGVNLKILLIKRGFEVERGRWSLMGGFVGADESLDDAANNILKELTGLKGVYLEQLHVFGSPNRDPQERVVSVAYFALIDIHKYEEQLNDRYQAEWFMIGEMPGLIFDHTEMIKRAQQKIRYKAALHPLLFELLPEKFTIPQLQSLYEAVYNTTIDKRNFLRKLTGTGLLIKLEEKDKSASRKGAFYFKLNKQKYRDNFQAFFNFIPNPDHLIGE